MDHKDASALVMDALAHAVAGDSHNATVAMMTLGQQSDGNEMYGVCCALASAGTMMLRRLYRDRAPRPGTSDMWAMHQLKPGAINEDAPKAFAVRFLIAYANGDTQTCLALYNAAYKASDEQYVDSIAALLADVAGITRLALDQPKDGRR